MSALAAHPNFILVRLEPSRSRPGRTEKLPVDWRTGKVSDAHDRSHWMPYHVAAPMPAMWGDNYVLGWVLTREAGIWCVDADHCISNGQWSGTAVKLFQLLHGAAVELSQSREGLHFWGSGHVPPHSSKCIPLKLECYTSDRFIALTGEILQGDASTDLSAAMASLVASCFPPRPAAEVDAPDEGPCVEWRGPTDDEELLRRALASHSAASAFGNRASFADLWTANAAVLAKCYPDSGDRPYDASSADAALAQHLAFWTGRDRGRIERLMRRSALARDKWDREDYMARTVHGACGRQVQVLQDAAPAAAAAVQVQAEPVIAALAGLPNEVVSAQWLGMAKDMDKAERDKLVGYVAHRMDAPAATLRGQIKAVEDAAAAAASQVAVAQAAGERALLLVRPDAPHVTALEIEAAILARARPGEYVSFGGVPAQVVVRNLPTGTAGGVAVAHIEPMGEADLLKVAASTSACYKPRKGGVQEMVEHPKAALSILLHQKAGGNAPTITGVLTHPTVRLDGTVLNTPGIDRDTGLFATDSVMLDCRAYTLVEARAAAQRLVANCLPGFRFESPQDRDAALSGFFLAVMRRVLDIAPGFAALANHQWSGKTTLCRAIHLVATGRDMPVSNLPMRDDGEGEKLIAAVLARNPEMVCFDNIPEGYTVRSKTLAQALTAAVFEARLLGVSRMLSCQTNVLIAVTGNNLSFGSDEVGRFLSTRLTGRGTDGPSAVLPYFMAVRQQVLQDIVGCVAGYIQHCGETLATPSRFVQWDRMVRYPMIWLGFSDPAASFEVNDARSEDSQALQQLLRTLADLYADKDFTTANLATAAAAGVGREGPLLRESLHMLGIDRFDNPRQIAHRLGAIVRKPVAGLMIERLPFNPSAGVQFRVARTG